MADKKPGALDIYKLLPRPNGKCGKCECLTCMAFAVAFLSRQKKVDDCELFSLIIYKDKRKELLDIEQGMAATDERGLRIDQEKCMGCGNCVVACPVNVANDPKGCAIGLGPKTGRVTYNGLKKLDTNLAENRWKDMIKYDQKNATGKSAGCACRH